MLSSALLLLTTNSGGNASIHKLTVGKDTNADAYGYNRNGDHIYGNLTPAECSRQRAAVVHVHSFCV